MTNIVSLPSARMEPSKIAPIAELLDMLFAAGSLDDDAYRLGYIVLSKFQAENSFTVALSWGEAAQTMVVCNGLPHSASHSADSRTFSGSLSYLQALAGIFSHTTKIGVNRAKDRLHNFAWDLGREGHPGSQLGQNTPVFFQYRPSRHEEVWQEAQLQIEKRLWAMRFARLDTKEIEKFVK